MRWAICTLFAAVLTLVVLQYSFQHGRLVNVPTYDDVGYFADGAQRLRTFYRDGIPGLWNTYWRQPPHSPFSTAMAIAAFAIFGIHDWSPYVMNSLLALGFFLAADWIFRGVKAGWRWFALLFVALLPFVGMAVHEFRPDFAVALFTCIGVFLIVGDSFVYAPRSRKLWAGAWLGIALITKPPVFPQTLVLGGAAVLLATLCDFFAAARRPKPGAIVAAWLSVLWPMLLLAFPHFFHDRTHIFSYIKSILWGTYEQSYAYEGTRRQHLLYFLTGPGGNIMLGRTAWILLFAWIAGGATLLFAGSRRDRLRVIAISLLVLLAWLIPTVNKTKSAYFGLAFDTLLAFAVLHIAARLFRIGAIRGGRIWCLQKAFVVGVVLVCAWSFQWPVRNGNSYAGWELQRNEIARGAFDAIVSHCDFYQSDVAPAVDPSVPDAQKVHTRQPAVLFCCRADFNDDLLKYMAAQKQVTLTTIFNGESSNPADLTNDFQKADFIVASEAGNPLDASFLPISSITQQLLDAMRERSEFVETGKWTFMKTTKSMFLFRRLDWTGFSPVSGLGDLEGPYKQYDMHNVRWGLGPATIIKVPVDRDGVYEFYWRCMSDLPNQVVSVKLDGKFVGQQAINFSKKEFGENRFPMLLKAGEHVVEFDYSDWHKDTPTPLAVLFAHFNVARRNNQALQ